MKRMADGRDSKQSDSNSNCSGNAPDLKRMRCVDDTHTDIGLVPVTVKTLADEKETDSHRLAQRQKQIDYGKNTIGYDRYRAQVSRRQRRRGKHPMTPDKTMRIGKKGFDKIVRKWRQALHKYDPFELAEVTREARSSAHSSAVNATLNESDEKKQTLLDSTSSLPSRSIYDSFEEDNFNNDEDDDDDDLL